MHALLENQKFKGQDNKDTSNDHLGTGFREDREAGKVGPTQHSLAMARAEGEQEARLKRQNEGVLMGEDSVKSRHPKDSEWPADRRINPNLASIKDLPRFNH